jgi:formylmethanofuran dehydrogenase subunit E
LQLVIVATDLREVAMNLVKDEDPRQEIEDAIYSGDLHKLLNISGMLHGHYCSFSALGVKAGARAMRELGIGKSTGMEEVVAIVETNSCFSDGVQIVTGCSFGNNALIYRDYGKTAFTLAKRSGEGLRIAVKPDSVQEQAPEASALFRKVIVERRGTEADQARVRKLWVDISFKLLDVPDEDVFFIQRVNIDVPSYARIFDSVKCSVCGENIMEPRARVREGKPVCLPCSGQDYYQLAGDGISIVTPCVK